jgi:hypothetical protein
MEVQPGFIAFIMTLITPNGFSRMVECRESFLVQFFFSLLFTCPISQSKRFFYIKSEGYVLLLTYTREKEMPIYFNTKTKSGSETYFTNLK